MVAIGVTGYRFLGDVARVAAGVDEALQRIEEAFPGEPWTVISALAEGADQLVVRRTLAYQQARLIVPLPLPLSEYLADFARPGSADRFLHLLDQADDVVKMPLAPTRGQAYESGGYYVLDHSDVLITIWDGREARGPGGTGDMVRAARQRGLPMAWIHTGDHRAGVTELAHPGEKQGTVRFERWPEPATK